VVTASSRGLWLLKATGGAWWRPVSPDYCVSRAGATPALVLPTVRIGQGRAALVPHHHGAWPALSGRTQARRCRFLFRATLCLLPRRLINRPLALLSLHSMAVVRFSCPLRVECPSYSTQCIEWSPAITVKEQAVRLALGLWAAMHRVVDDPDHLDRTIRLDEIMRFREAVEHFLPDLHPDPIRLGAYMEAYTPDHHALVGPLPGAEQILVLCGFSGHGFKLAPLMGDIAADLILEGRTERAVEQLLPHRLLTQFSTDGRAP
jgi:hypothetical protein